MPGDKTLARAGVGIFLMLLAMAGFAPAAEPPTTMSSIGRLETGATAGEFRPTDEDWPGEESPDQPAFGGNITLDNLEILLSSE